jgi:hypothetical protein
VVIGVVAAAAVVLVGILAFTGNVPDAVRGIVNTVTGRPDPCPLTGTVRGGEDPPARSVLGVKVENTDDAYPLAGLERADVVYEEPVEGGITRFAALFQCRDAGRVGPVRSARTTDPKILLQYAAEPLLAYSGAHAKVTPMLDEAGIVSLTETSAQAAYVRDSARSAPHNLFVSTKRLYRLASQMGVDGGAPEAVFDYENDVPTPSRPRTSATVAFSPATVVEWEWTDDRWVRLLDGAPMASEKGAPIAFDNLVIQEVLVTDSATIRDITGSPSPEVQLVGKGRAWILRDGRLIVGRWRRESLDDVTEFETRAGDEIAFKPGTTFVELLPKDDGDVTFAR